MASDADKERFRAAMAASTDKYVKQQGRNTIALNAESDPACAGYVRIPGSGACEFCVTMGAHDHFYRTRATAGGDANHGTKDDRYHAYCNCAIAMVFRRRGELVARDPDTGEAIPFDGADLVRRYNEIGRPTFAKNRAREAERRRASIRVSAKKAAPRNNAVPTDATDDTVTAARTPFFGRGVHQYVGDLTPEEYAAKRQDIEAASKRKTVKVSDRERHHIEHELNTNLTDDEWRRGVVMRPIGDYEYTVVVYGFDNFRIIGRKKLK